MHLQGLSCNDIRVLQYAMPILSRDDVDVSFVMTYFEHKRP